MLRTSGQNVCTSQHIGKAGFARAEFPCETDVHRIRQTFGMRQCARAHILQRGVRLHLLCRGQEAFELTHFLLGPWKFNHSAASASLSS